MAWPKKIHLHVEACRQYHIHVHVQTDRKKRHLGYPIPRMFSILRPDWLSAQEPHRYMLCTHVCTCMYIYTCVIKIKKGGVATEHTHRHTYRKKDIKDTLSQECAIFFPQIDPRVNSFIDVCHTCTCMLHCDEKKGHGRWTHRQTHRQTDRKKDIKDTLSQECALYLPILSSIAS